MKDTLVIFGSFDDGVMRESFNWSRQDCDLWVFNEAISKNHWVQWCTAVIQMHLPVIWRNPLNRNDKNHLDWMHSNDAIPVYMLEQYEEVPMARKYPFDEIVSTLLPHFEREKNNVWDDRGGYFTSSLAYALALGIYQGYKRIELWGIGLSINTEYVYQRPGAMFWIGLALGRGIDVVLKGHMFDAPLYGFQGDLFIPLDLFENRVKEIEEQIPVYTKMADTKQKLVGEALSNFKRQQIEDKEFIQVLQDKNKALVDLSHCHAIMGENKYYINKAQEMMKSNDDNDFRFSRSEFEQRCTAINIASGQLIQKRAATQNKVVEAWNRIKQIENRERRRAAIDKYTALYDEDLVLALQLSGMGAQVKENERYMRILDEQYRAAGMSKHDEKAGAEEQV